MKLPKSSVVFYTLGFTMLLFAIFKRWIAQDNDGALWSAVLATYWLNKGHLEDFGERVSEAISGLPEVPNGKG